MPFVYSRTVRFSDTDAAGVVYFANVLSICHEAYEASLLAASIDLRLFFNNSEIAIPIVHAAVDFFRPMYCGDRLLVHVTAGQLTEHKFEVNYQILSIEEALISKAMTRHVCIHPVSRSKIPISLEVDRWLHQKDFSTM